MYAIIKTGGKQYKVEAGDVVRVEKLDAELGSEMDLKEVLLVGGDKTFVGAPTLSGAKVTVVVTNQQRAPKVTIFKKKRRQGYRRMGGHRQPYTELFVKSITTPDGQTAKADGTAQVYNPEKKAENQAKTIEAREAFRQAAREGKAPEAKAAAAPKKKAAPKKAGVKKKSAKKSAGAKKSAKKTTKK